MINDECTTRANIPAVEGKDIHYFYGSNKKNPVLNGVNITVQRGIIYGLLGPSGCGKTTLLRCILGKQKAKEGSVRVYGNIPGKKGFFIPGRGVGYMPQDLSLYPEISTEETLSYFGRVYNMSHEHIEERISFLMNLLDLPDKDSQIKNLSGGQQRRVSFATALIHKPSLLILDEPTVGVDPLLRQAIWNHLVDLTITDNLTVIITTHYIEEARQANMVGMMRKGRLLAEMDPECIIKQHQSHTLENVFLKLCKQDENEANFASSSQIKIIGSPTFETNSPPSEKSDEIWLVNEVSKGKVLCYKENGSRCDNYSHSSNEVQDNTKALLEPSKMLLDTRSSTGTFWQEISTYWMLMSTLINKNLLRLRRNKALAIFEVFLPAIQVIVFCLCIGGEPFGLSLAIVNTDEIAGLGNVFLETINNRTITQIPFSNLSLAIESVKKGLSWGAIYIGPEFTSCMIKRVLDGVKVDNETIACSSVKVYMDMSNKQIAVSLHSTLLTNFITFSSEMLKTMGRNPFLAEPPLLVQAPIYGNTSTNFREFMAPGLILCIIFLMSVGLTAVAIILEKKQGLLERTFIAGVRPVDVVLSLFLSMYLVMALQVALVLLFTFAVFEIPSHGPLIWVIICILLSGTCGMSYGFLISAICDDENIAVMLALGTFYPLLLISGIIWPLESMSYYLRYISYSLPITLLGDSLRSIMLRGWDITDLHVWDGFLVTLSWSIAFLILSCIIFRLRN